jgi:hypothetical protein
VIGPHTNVPFVCKNVGQFSPASKANPAKQRIPGVPKELIDHFNTLALAKFFVSRHSAEMLILSDFICVATLRGYVVAGDGRGTAEFC